LCNLKYANAFGEKRKESIIGSEEEEKSNQFILCKLVHRSCLGEKISSLISYIGVSSVVYLKYPLGFVITLLVRRLVD